MSLILVKVTAAHYAETGLECHINDKEQPFHAHVWILRTRGRLFPVNVFDYPAIRESVKQYSERPTASQLLVDGELICGCNIITGVYQSGDLEEEKGRVKYLVPCTRSSRVVSLQMEEKQHG
mmetsp:Transcript_19584/g.28617  ORF Transcript_19584/g.28617 Transcript_19584/m.28617 type:complete len:122 (-) Transcript_19584:26-391(-)